MKFNKKIWPIAVALLLVLQCLLVACSDEATGLPNNNTTGTPANGGGLPGQAVITPTPTPPPPTPTYTPLPVTPTPQPTPLPPSTQGGKISGAVINEALTLHPYKTNNATGKSYVNLLFAAALTHYDPQTLQPQPNAAASWTVSESTITFTLKEGLKWSDGKPITSADYLWTYQQAIKPENGWPLAKAALAGNDQNGIESYEAVDSRTLKIKLKMAASDIVNRADIIEPLPKHIWEKLDWNKNPQMTIPSVVSGPWRLKEWKRGSSITFESNSASSIYPAPHLDSLVFYVLSDNQIILQKLKAGELDFYSPTLQDWAEFEKLPNVQAYTWWKAQADWYFAGFNFRKPLLQDKIFRQALAWAIDRQFIIDKYSAGLGQFLNSSVPQAHPAFEPFTARYEYKPDKVRLLLTQNGYSQKDGKLLGKNGQPVAPLKLVFNAPSQLYEGIATKLKADWAEIGLQVETRNYDLENYRRLLASPNPDFDIFLGGWATDYAPENFGDIWRAIPALNSGAYENPRLLEAYNKAASETDPTKRKEWLGQIQAIEAEELPYLFLYAEAGHMVATKRVAGFDPKLLEPERNLYTDWFVVR